MTTHILKGKVFDEIVYGVVRDENKNALTLKLFQVKLERNLTEQQIWDYIYYSYNLGSMNSSEYWRVYPLPKLEEKEKERSNRIKAIAFNDTINKIKLELGKSLVAYSHRYGGWYTIKWIYNDEIRFDIATNFGYGSASYFTISYYYKDKKLAPYSNYIYYRYAQYASIVSYTYPYPYPLQYKYWKNLLEDTILFYNAVSYRQEAEVFDWIKGHLEKLVYGLKNLLKSDSFSIFNCVYNVDNKENVIVTGEELIILKAEKIGGATLFVKNIKELPSATTPNKYIDLLNGIFKDFLEWVQPLIKNYQDELDTLVDKEKEIINSPLVKTYLDLLNSNTELYMYSIYTGESKQSVIIKLRVWLKIRLEKYPNVSNKEIREELIKPLKLRDENIIRQLPIKRILDKLNESHLLVKEYVIQQT